MNGAIPAVLASALLMAGSTLAQEKPVGTINFSGGSVSVGVGYTWGSGVLTYKGKDYPSASGVKVTLKQ